MFPSRAPPASLLLFTGECVARAEVVVVWTVEDIPSRLGVRFTWLTGNDHLAWERLLAYQAGGRPRASVRIPLAPEGHGVVPGLRFLSDDREGAFFVAGTLLRQLLDPQEASSDRSVYLLALLARTAAGPLPG